MVRIGRQAGTLSADELADRLALLLDFAETGRGASVTYPEIAAYVEAQGLSLSRAKWSYMTAGGGRRNKDEALLGVLSEFFEVDPAFLTTDGEIPERIARQIQLVEDLRVARVTNFAARTFRGDLSPTALEAISQILADEAGKADEEAL